MDPFTFGRQKSAVNLCDILTRLNNQKLTSKVAKYIHKVYEEQNWTIKRQECLRKLYLKDKVEKVSRTNWPEDVKSHVICLIYAITNHRIWGKRCSGAKENKPLQINDLPGKWFYYAGELYHIISRGYNGAWAVPVVEYDAYPEYFSNQTEVCPVEVTIQVKG